MNPQSNINNLKVISYNCKSLKSSLQVLKDLCSICDVILLQETWLCDFELDICNNIHPDFYGQGITSVDTGEGILTGRPYGGLSILWRKSLGKIG